QSRRLGRPDPRRIRPGHDDGAVVLPDDDAIRAACVLQTPRGEAARAHGAAGQPNMPFGPIGWEGENVLSGPNFPDNLRLRPGYEFGRAANKS
ncbi:MAG: hypothetical protein ACKOD2_15350, partial [Ilumatobacteraceae bacterium]